MSKKLQLSIRATNGATWDTDQFGGNQKVAVVRKAAERHFIDGGEMAPGDYVLALLVDGNLVDLADSVKLEDVPVPTGSVLALLPRNPQVDG